MSNFIYYWLVPVIIFVCIIAWILIKKAIIKARISRQMAEEDDDEPIPTRERNTSWIYEGNTYKLDKTSLFSLSYSRDEIDEAWSKCKKLYRNGDIYNAIYIRCSTAASEDKEHIGYYIQFHYRIGTVNGAINMNQVESIKDMIAKVMNYRKSVSYIP
jgi:anthranilate/para-aminobenzoate synthase component I